MVSLTFDARTVEPSSGFEPVPAGWYNVAIDDTEMRPTKKGDGAYLNVRFSILDGQYAGQKIFQRLNLQNPSQAAKEIAFKQLSAICHSVGMLSINDSSELHGKPLKVRVKVRKDEEYGDSNDVTSLKNINEPTPGSSGAVVPGAPGAPSAPAAPQGWGGAPAAPAAPAAPLQPVPLPPPANVAPLPVPAATLPPAPVDPYQYTPDKKQRWKPGMAQWEVVPEAPPASGWVPPAATQPWAAPTPPAPEAPPAAPTPPWMTPRS